MRPVLLRWRGITVWSYPAFLYLGLIAAVATGNFAARAAGVDALRTFVAMHVLIVAALVGARLLYVLSNGGRYRAEPRRIWSRRDGGAAMYGALPLVLPLSVPLLALLRLPLGAFWDVAAVSILAGMIFTRVGCLLNGCCAGRRVGARRIPTQALEAAFAALLLAGAAAAWGRTPFAGALFLGVAVGYGAGRLVLESLREPKPGARNLTIHHALSAALMVSSLAVLAVRWPR